MMKPFALAGFLAAQLLAGLQPALAAELAESRTPHVGAFAGFRMRLPLDGHGQQRRLRAGLAIAPSMQSRAASGESRLSIGEGLELGFAGDEPVRLSLGGTPVSRLAQGPAGPDGRRAGVSTLGWVAIGVGGLVVVTLGAAALVADHISDCERSDDC